MRYLPLPGVDALRNAGSHLHVRFTKPIMGLVLA